VALRFARVRQYRPDKMAAEADSIDRLRGLLRCTERSCELIVCSNA